MRHASRCQVSGVSTEVAATDLDGNPRILNGTVDMGAYEFHFDGNVKVMLQGGYEAVSNAMMTAVGTNVPLRSPYAADVRTAAAIPSDTADWMLVQVRRSPTNTPTFSRSMFLRSDGVIAETDRAIATAQTNQVGYKAGDVDLSGRVE